MSSYLLFFSAQNIALYHQMRLVKCFYLIFLTMSQQSLFHHVNKRQQYEIFKHSHLIAQTLFCGTNIFQNLWVTARHIWYLPLVWAYPLQWRPNGRARWRLKSPASGLLTQPLIQGADHLKHQSSPSLAFIRGIHRWPVNSPHKGPVTRKMFLFDDVIIWFIYILITRVYQYCS